LSSSDVATAVASSTLDSSKCEPPGENSLLQSLGCSLWCPQVTVGETTDIVIRFFYYSYISGIVLSQGAPIKTSNTTIFLKKSEVDYVSIEELSERVVSF